MSFVLAKSSPSAPLLKKSLIYRMLRARAPLLDTEEYRTVNNGIGPGQDGFYILVIKIS